MSDLSTKNEARPCEPGDLFQGDIPDEAREALANYLKAFAAPIRREGKTHCLKCDEPVNSILEFIGFGVAFKWTLAHGEAACSGCGWPARGIHRISLGNGERLCTLTNVFLSYHPDEIARWRKVTDAEDAKAEHEALEIQSTGRL